jgi:hypothetical protein
MSNIPQRHADHAQRLREIRDKYGKQFDQIDPPTNSGDLREVSEVPKRAIQNLGGGDSTERILEYLQDLPARIEAIIEGAPSVLPPESRMNMMTNSLKSMGNSIKSFYIDVTKVNPWD